MTQWIGKKEIKRDRIVSLEKTELNTIEILISRAFILKCKKTESRNPRDTNTPRSDLSVLVGRKTNAIMKICDVWK